MFRECSFNHWLRTWQWQLPTSKIPGPFVLVRHINSAFLYLYRTVRSRGVTRELCDHANSGCWLYLEGYCKKEKNVEIHFNQIEGIGQAVSPSENWLCHQPQISVKYVQISVIFGYAESHEPNGNLTILRIFFCEDLLVLHKKTTWLMEMSVPFWFSWFPSAFLGTGL